MDTGRGWPEFTRAPRLSQFEAASNGASGPLQGAMFVAREEWANGKHTHLGSVILKLDNVC